jgi:hypothetical protein
MSANIEHLYVTDVIHFKSFILKVFTITVPIKQKFNNNMRWLWKTMWKKETIDTQIPEFLLTTYYFNFKLTGYQVHHTHYQQCGIQEIQCFSGPMNGDGGKPKISY